MLMAFHWTLSDSKSPQVSRILLSILAILNNALVWMVSTRPPTSKSSSPLNNPIGIIFHCFFQFFGEVEVPIFLFTFCPFYSVVSWNCKIDNFSDSLLFLLIIIRSGLLAEIRWSERMSKYHKRSCVFFKTDDGLCIYHLLVRSKLNFLHISLCITLLTQSCLVLYTLWVNWLCSHII